MVYQPCFSSALMVIAGEDYGLVASETVLFTPGGGRTVCLPVELNDDEILEGSENFPLVIESVSPSPGVVIGPLARTNVIIQDNDSRFLTDLSVMYTPMS